MKSIPRLVLFGILLALSLAFMRETSAQAPIATDESVVKQGLAIAPVHLDLRGKNRALVGMGSYIVNAVSECNDCHTRPHYLAGGNPFNGESERDNMLNHLTGGNQFGPFTSANLTPDANGLPAGMTLEAFITLIRTGHTDDHPLLGPLLQ